MNRNFQLALERRKDPQRSGIITSSQKPSRLTLSDYHPSWSQEQSTKVKQTRLALLAKKAVSERKAAEASSSQSDKLEMEVHSSKRAYLLTPSLVSLEGIAKYTDEQSHSLSLSQISELSVACIRSEAEDGQEIKELNGTQSSSVSQVPELAQTSPTSQSKQKALSQSEQERISNSKKLALDRLKQKHPQKARAAMSRDKALEIRQEKLREKTAAEIRDEGAPKKSALRYEQAWVFFCDYRKQRDDGDGEPGEDIYTTYFDYLKNHKGMKASSVWTIYSRLNNCHQVRVIIYGYLHTYILTYVYKNLALGCVIVLFHDQE